MPRGEKPYRVYRGGRVKGRVPLETRPTRTPGRQSDGRARYRGPGPKRPKRRWGWGRIVVVGIIVLLLLITLWGGLSYVAFAKGVHAANDRLPERARAALVKQDGLLLSKSTSILVLGTDHAKTNERSGLRHSDSMMVIRTDPKHHRLYYLSILRDLRVEIPGYGTQKINAAFQFGGAPLAIRTVRSVTGLPINHVVLVDFADFQKLIDDLGGVTVDVPAPILSNKFDCPYPPRRCASWPGWRFRKGNQKMDGRRALVYSRIRENQLNPKDTDASRAGRQQQVMQAITSKVSGPGTLIKMPFVGDNLLKPVATDLSPWQLLQLGWVKFRAGSTIHCRLGGTASGGYILRDEQAASVLLMVEGKSAPQPPPPGSLFGSGCSNRVLGAG
jgi:LCP family protein required for cell wall assembly